MAVFRPKSRMISFRLSEDEYEILKKDSLSHGARSVSDYARSTLRRFMAGQAGIHGDGFEAGIEQLDGRMQELNRELQRLLRVVERQQEGVRPSVSG
jgi:hypothetical protein